MIAVDQQQVDDSKKDKETLSRILESKQAAEESARRALKSELALARAQVPHIHTLPFHCGTHASLFPVAVQCIISI